MHQGGEKIAAGDYEFRNRVYSPSLGRWLSNDPLGFDAGDQNWYRAVGNNPGNRLDSSGLNYVDPFNPNSVTQGINQAILSGNIAKIKELIALLTATGANAESIKKLNFAIQKIHEAYNNERSRILREWFEKGRIPEFTLKTLDYARHYQLIAIKQIEKIKELAKSPPGKKNISHYMKDIDVHRKRLEKIEEWMSGHGIQPYPIVPSVGPQ